MTLRERIADWISGGELSRLLIQNDQLNEAYWAQRDAFSAIAACETPRRECHGEAHGADRTGGAGMTPLILATAALQCLPQPEMVARLAMEDLVANSEGVSGLHMNGDMAPWSEIMDGGAFDPRKT